jgi:hypothetical protein
MARMTRRGAIGALAGGAVAVAGCGVAGRLARRERAPLERFSVVGQAVGTAKPPTPAPPRWADLLDRARAADLRVLEGRPLEGPVGAVLLGGVLSLRSGVGELQRRRLLSDALARPGDVDVFLEREGRAYWLMRQAPDAAPALAI